jgi:hypothetical protein
MVNIKYCKKPTLKIFTFTFILTILTLVNLTLSKEENTYTHFSNNFLSLSHSSELNLLLLQEINNLESQNHIAMPQLTSSSTTEGIQPGMGYSSDSQSLAKAICYKTVTVLKSGQSSLLHFNEAIDYNKMLQTFNLDVDIKGGYGLFSTNDMFQYMKTIQDDSLSLSINYYQKVSDNVVMTFSYDPKNILTDVGKNIYQDGKNPMFRLLCGDYLITSYEEGAVLILSMKILFSSKEEKKNFQTKIGVSVGGFINASASINKAAEEMKLSGRIEISAYQMGGDPTQLSKLLASSVIDCDIKDIKSCQDTAKSLINYVSNIFPTQFSKDEKGVWTSSLVPLNSYQKDYLVSDFGLKLTPSYVTDKVKENRKNLVNFYNKFNYYINSLDYIIKKYPVKTERIFSDYFDSLNYNLNSLITGDGQNRAIDCFTFPFKCPQIYDNIYKQLNLTIVDSITNLFEEMKYYIEYSVPMGNTDCVPDDVQWDKPWVFKIMVDPVGNKQYSLDFNTQKGYEFSNFSVNSLSEVSFNAKFLNFFTWTGTVIAKEDKGSFIGIFNCKNLSKRINQDIKIKGEKVLSSFYVEPYQNK